ncbi:nucleoside-diphosphate-sugar epimerase [Pseudomonas sp. SJZ079]|uniref:GDP-mannose 4,6-dehydratase n=1 Tax=Pseudomonas sp. SJZ079 TaxID=2572887 RepID=UPI00119C6072|nr:GDP-mannose 4,6-dehydratase [Pseudomonas sp. SJZ079]TWC34972.1 nucleoside-diphosphate-sugar epimerase [Pseudomonas sp. SJZ079]
MSHLGKHVLITGILGFTGRYMAEELITHGYRVSGLGTQSSQEPEYYQVDLTDNVGLKNCLAQLQPDIVIHLAALAFVGHSDPNAFYQTNLMGTRNLLDAVSTMGKQPECVLLASSANVYGNATAGMIDEQARMAPVNEYAVSKMAMEAMANLWQERLPLVITRPFNYTGVGQAEQFLLPKIVAHFRRRAARIELGNLDVWRDFTDVRALIQAYRRLIESGHTGEPVNVCSGRPHSLREIIVLCEQITGHSLEIHVNPTFVRSNEVKTLCGDATRLRQLIGDWDTPPLEETLRWMLCH